MTADYFIQKFLEKAGLASGDVDEYTKIVKAYISKYLDALVNLMNAFNNLVLYSSTPVLAYLNPTYEVEFIIRDPAAKVGDILVWGAGFDTEELIKKAKEVWRKNYQDWRVGFIFVVMLRIRDGVWIFHSEHNPVTGQTNDNVTPPTRSIIQSANPPIVEAIVNAYRKIGSLLVETMRKIEAAQQLRLQEHQGLVEKWRAEIGVDKL